MSGRIIALDWGEVRIGVALSDENQSLASPLTTLRRRPGRRFPYPAFKALLGTYSPVGCVIGLPLDADGGEGESALAARALGDVVLRRSELPITYVDERFTSARALAVIREMGGTVRGRKEDVDALAAAILLQQFLDSRHTEG